LGVWFTFAKGTLWVAEINAGGDKSKQESEAFHTMLPAAGQQLGLTACVSSRPINLRKGRWRRQILNFPEFGPDCRAIAH
jgi:hypothetical protein